MHRLRRRLRAPAGRQRRPQRRLVSFHDRIEFLGVTGEQREWVVDGVMRSEATGAGVMHCIIEWARDNNFNLDGAHALGISGKDGALFRAKKRRSAPRGSFSSRV